MTEKSKTIICRVCLRSDSKIKKKCMSLFEKYKNGVISDTINSIAKIGIQENDGLPQKICPDCLLELDTAINFKSKCESSDNLLRSTLLNDNIIVKSDDIAPDELDIEIKKEEPYEEPLGDYGEVDFLNDDYLDDSYDLKNSPQEILEVIKEKPKSKAIDLKLECHDCGGFFKSKCKMKVHWKKVHLPEKLICKTCMRAFKSYKAFNKHVNSNNTNCNTANKVNIEGTGKNRVFHCKDCSYQSRRIKDIQSHLYTHSGDRPFQCTICQKNFTQQSSLQGHQESAHKMFKMETTCQYCGKYLKGRNQVYRHLKTHSEKSLQCDICKKMLGSKKSLILHLTRHTGVKMFTCELCACTFYTLSELCNHKRIKHDKKKYRYKCDICGYITARNDTLKKHKKKHTANNVCCVVCGFFVPDAEALLLHQKRHMKKFPCSYCDSKYARKDSLHKHVRSKHKFTFAALPSKPVVVKTENNTTANRYDNMIEIEVSPISN